VEAPVVWPIEFGEEQLLPRAQFEPAVLNGDGEAVPDDDGAQMRIGILATAIGMPRIVVVVIHSPWDDLLEHRRHIAQQRLLHLIQDQPGRRVQRGDLRQPITDERLCDDLGDLLGDVFQLHTCIGN